MMQNTIIYKIIIYSIVIIFSLIVSWILFQKTLKKLYKPLFLSEPYKNSTKNKSLSIVTYNIQKFPFLFKSFKPIKDLLEKHSIILLQECYDETFDSLETHFPNHYICRGTLKGINVMNSGLAIISAYPILETSFTRFNNYNALTFDRFTEKGYLTALIDISESTGIKNKKMMIVNTHLQSCDFEEYDPIALLQLQELLDYAHYITTPYIIGGDFNIDVKESKNRYSMLSIHQPMNPTIYINFKNAHSKSTPGDKYVGLIFDYFITGGGCGKLETKTIVDEYSDHNPVSGLINF